MIQLNLLPDIKREFLKARRTQAKVISTAILVCIGSVGAVVLAGMWVYGVQTIHKAALTDSIQKKSTELKNIKDIDKYVTVQNQLQNISSQHESKAITSRIFDTLSKLNPKAPNNVRVTSLDLDLSPEVSALTLDGETESFTGLETFRDTLKNASLSYNEGSETINEPLFLDGSVTVLTQSIGKSQSGGTLVAFRISAKYNPKLFARSTKNYVVVVPNKDTTQSKEDTPDVFGDTQAAGGGQ